MPYYLRCNYGSQLLRRVFISVANIPVTDLQLAFKFFNTTLRTAS